MAPDASGFTCCLFGVSKEHDGGTDFHCAGMAYVDVRMGACVGLSLEQEKVIPSHHER